MLTVLLELEDEVFLVISPTLSMIEAKRISISLFIVYNVLCNHYYRHQDSKDYKSNSLYFHNFKGTYSVMIISVTSKTLF